MGKSRKSPAKKSDKPDQPKSDIPEKPDGVPDALWNLIVSIKQDTQNNGLRLQALEAQVTEVSKKNSDLSDTVNSLDYRITTLEAKLIRSETINKRLHHEIIDLKARSMKSNIIFSFDSKSQDFGKEVEGEDCVALIRHFLSTVMHIVHAEELYIPVAHRLGISKTGAARQIIAQFPISYEYDLVFKQTNRLRDTAHSLTRQLPPAQRERMHFALKEYKQKRQNPQNKARLVNDKLYVKGKLQYKYQPPSLPVVDPTDDDVKEYSITQSETITDSGSKFKGFAAEVDCIEDVSAVLEQSLHIDNVPSASHRIYAYRYKDRTGIHENFNSDGDDGVGLELLKGMQESNICDQIWIATRHCMPGYSHIGVKRFHHVKTACGQASEQLA